MSPRSHLKKLGGVAAALLLGVMALGHVFITDEGGYVVTWPAGPIPMQVKLATSPALSDGTSQSGSVVAAMQAWNTTLGTVQFASQQMGPGAYEIGNDLSEIVMDSTIDGLSFGGNTLAVTVSFRTGNTRTESDIIFNTAWSWDSYRGSLREPEDIRRVAIHELGHVLGLNHPDQGGQSVTAVMNSTVSNVDALQSDDIAGGQALYGAPGFVPGNDNFANATAIVLTGGSVQMIGTNVAATADTGEPAHAGETARHSVWWKWAASGGGNMTITTLGSNFDTVIGVYTGSTVSGLTEVVSNDDVDPGVIRTGTVTFRAEAGITYHIAVDGWDGYTGLIVLNAGFVPVAAHGDASHIKIRVSGSPVAGGSTTLALEGAGGITEYQWRFRGAAIPGATQATLALTGLSRANAGFYDAIVTVGGQQFTVESTKLEVAPSAAYNRLEADPDFAPVFENAETGEVTAWLRLPNGRIMIGGRFTKVDGVDSAYLALLNADGTRYTGFVPPALNGPVHALAAAGDGKVYVGGEFSECDGVAAGRMIRLNADLTRDTGFNIGIGFNNAVYTVVPLADGKAYVGGSFNSFGGGFGSYGVARLNADGTRDTGFTLGYMSSPGSGRPAAVYALAVQSDGRVVAGGEFNSMGSGSPQNLARLSTTGQPENTSWNHLGPPGPIYALLMLPDGRFMVGGDFPFIQYVNGARLLRFNPDFNVDTTFDLASSLKGSGAVRAIARLADGRLLVGGSDGFPTVLLGSEGAVEVAQPTVPFADGMVRSIMPQADGTFFLGGQLSATAGGGESSRFTFYTPTSGTFGALGAASAQGLGSVGHVELLANGRLLVRGSFTHVNGVARRGLARLLSDGSTDAGFNPGETVSTTDTGRFAVQGDGKILIHTGTHLIRLTESGALDSSFAAAPYTPADLDIDFAGRPLVASSATGGLFPNMNGLKRLTTTGVVDGTFSAVSVSGTLQDVFPLANGSLFTAGQFGQLNGQSSNNTFIRLTAAGEVDASFNPGFSSSTRLWTKGITNRIYRLAEFSVDRFSAAGYRDSGFTYAGTSTALTAVAALPDGSLYRAATPASHLAGQPEMFFGRHFSSGALDPSFIPAGLSMSSTMIRQILPLDDGAVILVGARLRQGESRATQLTRMRIPASLRATSVSRGAAVATGDPVTLSVAMEGAGPYTYQWYRNGFAINGATSATLSLGAAQGSVLGEYSVRVSLASGAAVVFGPMPVVASQLPPVVVSTTPEHVSVATGAPVALSVAAAGPGPHQFQWFRDGIAIPGATASVFTLSSAARANAGIYHLVASAGLAEVKSPPTVLAVMPRAAPMAMDLDAGFEPVIERLGAQVTALAMAADGRVVVGGAFTRVSTVTRHGLARFLADGSLDSSFTPPAFDGPIYAIVIDASGRIVVAGDFVRVGTSSAGRIVRLLADGSIDASFSRSPGFDGPVHALLLQPDGRIVASGAYNQVHGATQAVLARLNMDGSKDASFAPGFAPSEVVKCMALQSDGKVVTASMPRTESSSGGLQAVTLQRWHSNGTADASFVPSVTPAGYAYTMAVLPNGDVLVGGLLAYYGSFGSVYSTTLRMSSAGINNAAWQTSSHITGAYERAMAVRPDGHIWMVSASDDGSRGIVRRYSDSGILQANSFSNIPALAAGLLPDGRFLIGGMAGATGLTQNRGLAPIANNASVAADWNAVFERTATVRALAAAEAGKVYIGGDFRRINGALMNRIARLNADGSLDTGFVIGTGFDNEVSHLIALADGGVMAAGRFSNFNGSAAGPIARLQANGSVLPGFVPPGAGLSTIAAMHLDTKGRLWLGGEFGEISGVSRQRLARFSATSGQLDLAYNPQNAVSVFGAMLPALDATSLVVSGWLTTTYSSDIGRLDDSAAPIHNFPASLGNTTKAGALAWLPDGKILSGSEYSSSGTAAFVRRLGADGVYDSTFVSPQLAITGVRKLIAQGEGSHLVLGYDGAARIGAAGALDSTFSLSRAVKGKFSDMLLLDDGSLLVSGGLATSSGRPMALARLKSLAPSIALQPSSLSITPGQPVSFTVGVNGSGLSYQWRKGGTNLGNGGRISGATAAALTIEGTDAGDAGGYDVIVSNSVGSVISVQALLSFSITSQTITFAPLADRAFTAEAITLTATASSGLPVTFTVHAGPATISSNQLTLTGTGTVTVRASQAGDATYVAATPVDRSFVVTGNFSSWLAGQFTTVELADAAISGPNSDPDGDGYSNLLEYALGLEPRTPSTTGLPEVAVVGSDWVYTYTRPADRTELTYAVEVSADLTNWTTTNITSEIVTTSGGVETWRAKYALASGANLFFRLRITSP